MMLCSCDVPFCTVLHKGRSRFQLKIEMLPGLRMHSEGVPYSSFKRVSIRSIFGILEIYQVFAN